MFILSEALDEQLKALWFSPFQTDDIETDLDTVSVYCIFTIMIIPRYLKRFYNVLRLVSSINHMGLEVESELRINRSRNCYCLKYKIKIKQFIMSVTATCFVWQMKVDLVGLAQECCPELDLKAELERSFLSEPSSPGHTKAPKGFRLGKHKHETFITSRYSFCVF